MRLDNLSAADALSLVYGFFHPKGVGQKPRQHYRARSNGEGWGLVDAMTAGKILAAVDTCSPALKSWSMWAHTDEGTGTDHYTLMVAIKDQFDIDKVVAVRGLDHAIQIVRLISAVIDDHQATCQSRRGCKRLAALIGVDECQFKAGRSWTKVKEFIECALASYETSLQEVVGAALDELRGGADDYNV